MKVKCIDPVLMTESKKEAFTEGKNYTIYKSTYKDGYEVFPCLRAKNNQNELHIILSNELNAEDFFEKHFKLTV